MPTFRSSKGGDVWVSAHTIMRVEPGPGGLSSVLVLIPPPGATGHMAIEVEGRVETIGAALDDALSLFDRTTRTGSLLDGVARGAA